MPEITVKANGKTYKVTKIAKEACEGMNKLEEVTIGKNVQVIGNNAFYGCTDLVNITIGAGLKKIGKEAFDGCMLLRKILIKSKNLTSIGKNAFKKLFKGVKFYVPSNKITKYEKMIKKAGAPSTVTVKKLSDLKE